MNHKNFVNLIGYCVEERPFTRMMVFEYAPNGTLFEHLHSKCLFSHHFKVIILMSLCYLSLRLAHLHFFHNELITPKNTKNPYFIFDFVGRITLHLNFL